MRTFDVGIPCERSLEQIETTIATEEAMRARFLGNRVHRQGREATNVATFEERSFGPRLPRLKLTVKAAALGDPKPEWEGEMCVENNVVHVRAFRGK
ncbi:hypothetical protein QPK31_12070 [Massilia sp. YIM B02769]|uniref:hypothetical protein n=1 Tax=unclassified Massilia TaxID=2609279 RepID=UPI0025B72641|nr:MULTISPECIES: hypothetical protein [unclassified Massilia]MDN4058957.1 hypothetical protein [Massilia sp. YIM B02769]